jgi:uncharacterized protein YjbJ (UPF0337 family)
MGLSDKAKNSAEENLGKAKEKVGDATGNKSLAREGELDQAKANVKQGVEHVKDAFDDDDSADRR